LWLPAILSGQSEQARLTKPPGREGVHSTDYLQKMNHDTVLACNDAPLCIEWLLLVRIPELLRNIGWKCTMRDFRDWRTVMTRLNKNASLRAWVQEI
jgi:hypothetical protein